MAEHVCCPLVTCAGYVLIAEDVRLSSDDEYKQNMAEVRFRPRVWHASAFNMAASFSIKKFGTKADYKMLY